MPANHSTGRMTVADAELFCAENGIHLTPLRKSVLGIVLSATAPIRAYVVMDRLGRQMNKRVAPPTAYRTLEFLQMHGLVHRIEILNAYVGATEPGTPTPQVYLMCDQCGEVLQMNAADLNDQINLRANTLGFVVTRPVIEATGLCPACKALPQTRGPDASQG